MPGGGKLVGLRHQVQSEPDPDWLARPDVLRGLAAVADAGLVYDLVITAGQLAPRPGPRPQCPDLRFVLDHLGKPPVASGRTEPWAQDLRRLAALPNTVAKLSGLVTEADWHALEGRRPASLRRHRAGGVRPGPDDVRLGLAGVYPGRRLRRRPRGGP